MPTEKEKKSLNFSVRLTPELNQKVQEVAEKNHWSRNKAIVLMLEDYLRIKSAE